MRFYLGERKEVGIQVYSKKTQDFKIRNASYSLLQQGVEIENGMCQIEGVKIFVLLEPKSKGFFDLFFTYEIANEKLKAKLLIEVE